MDIVLLSCCQTQWCYMYVHCMVYGYQSYSNRTRRNLLSIINCNAVVSHLKQLFAHNKKILSNFTSDEQTTQTVTTWRTQHVTHCYFDQGYYYWVPCWQSSAVHPEPWRVSGVEFSQYEFVPHQFVFNLQATNFLAQILCTEKCCHKSKCHEPRETAESTSMGSVSNQTVSIINY